MSECCIQLQEYYETIVNNKRSSKVFDEVQNTYILHTNMSVVGYTLVLAILRPHSFIAKVLTWILYKLYSRLWCEEIGRKVTYNSICNFSISFQIFLYIGYHFALFPKDWWKYPFFLKPQKKNRIIIIFK